MSEKSVTDTLAVPVRPPLAAVTVNGPPAVEPALNKPDEPIVPPPLTDQVNDGCGLKAWPNWSRPVALNCCVPPAWTEALAGATVIVARTGGAAVTETLAVPVRPPLAAVTVNGPPAVEPALNKPDEPIVPPPLTDQPNDGCGLKAWPNWSRPVALNCCVPPAWTEALAGATVIVARTGGAAVTETLAVPVRPPLAAVTVNGPPAVEPALNRPAEPIVPPPLTDQVNDGCGLKAWPNWSRPVALNCCVPPAWTEALAGATVIVARTGGAAAKRL